MDQKEFETKLINFGFVKQYKISKLINHYILYDIAVFETPYLIELKSTIDHYKTHILDNSNIY